MHCSGIRCYATGYLVSELSRQSPGRILNGRVHASRLNNSLSTVDIRRCDHYVVAKRWALFTQGRTVTSHPCGFSPPFRTSLGFRKEPAASSSVHSPDILRTNTAHTHPLILFAQFLNAVSSRLTQTRRHTAVQGGSFT